MTISRDTTIIPYLTTIWILQHEARTRVGVTMLRERLGKAPATVSQTVRALTDARLIRHEPYGPIELTLQGEELALAAVRHNRMARAFLHRTLGCPWPDIAAEAERLAPVLHEDLARRLHEVAGAPDKDPYGNAIPGVSQIPAPATEPLADRAPGDTAEILRVADSEVLLLRRLHSLGLTPGAIVEIRAIDSIAEVLDIRCDDITHRIGVSAASKIFTITTACHRATSASGLG